MTLSFPIRRLIAIAGIMATALTLAGSAVSQVGQIRTSQAGELHALIIGVDDYQFMPRLKGAVADGRDIESTLRSNGVTSVSMWKRWTRSRTALLATSPPHTLTGWEAP